MVRIVQLQPLQRSLVTGDGTATIKRAEPDQVNSLDDRDSVIPNRLTVAGFEPVLQGLAVGPEHVP